MVSVVEKYLRNYSEFRDTDPSQGAPSFRRAAFVPACHESPRAVPRLLEAWSASGHADLLVFVVNERVDAAPEQSAANAEFLAEIARHTAPRERNDEVVFRSHADSHPGARVAVLDRTQGDRRLGRKEGVGRARRIGFDFALALFAAGKLESPWVGSTDADATITSDYFESLALREPDVVACLYPYVHTPSGEPEADATMQLVEAGFRYYELGLDWAGSPYSFHALGSALSVRLDAYATVRGVPNRQAGEDFYLLSKLAKVGALLRLEAPLISLETRVSSRVPFGTGQALRDALERVERIGVVSEAVRVPDPRAFAALRVFLSQVEERIGIGQGAAPEIPASLAIDEALEAWVATARDELVGELTPLLDACPTPEHRRRRLHERWDSLRTLQFLHGIERGFLPRVPVVEALSRWWGPALGSDPGHFSSELERLGGALPARVGVPKST